ncbi:hypothetical protein, partial [uncultured Bacteroides sp.]|uniref:hypothetical protein n=2 Tax=uncultured Bacteroides sp. TaxID=162156 RepID=UPI0025963AD4
ARTVLNGESGSNAADLHNQAEALASPLQKRMGKMAAVSVAIFNCPQKRGQSEEFYINLHRHKCPLSLSS